LSILAGLEALRYAVRDAEESAGYSFSAGGVIPISVDFKDSVLEHISYDDDGNVPSEAYFVDDEQCDNTFFAPSIQIDGFGPLSFPLNASTSKAVLKELKSKTANSAAVMSRAPFGRGTKTITDLSVRKTWQIEADKLSLPKWFSERIEPILLKQAVEGLGEDNGNDYQLHLQKLLIYEQGDFFAPHADHETRAGMLGSLILILPTEFCGGELVVRAPTGNGASEPDKSKQVTYDFAENSRACMQYATFYGDCCHEVMPVTGGLRVCLTYNIVPRQNEAWGEWKPNTTYYPGEDVSPETMTLAEKYLKQMLETKSSRKVIYHMDHHYSLQSLHVQFLKGKDRRTANLLTSLVEKCNEGVKGKLKLSLQFDFLQIQIKRRIAEAPVATEWYPETTQYAVISNHPDDCEESGFKVHHYQYDAGNRGGGTDEEYRQAVMIVAVEGM
jgi:hypothetical protein